MAGSEKGTSRIHSESFPRRCPAKALSREDLPRVPRSHAMKTQLRAFPKTLWRLLILSTALLTAEAQTTVVTYQGRVQSDGKDFSGTGQFKFALVTVANTAARATAVANPPTGGFITIINVTFGGSGYATAPAVTISGGGGSGARATAAVSGGVVTSITVNNPGSGYTSTPIATIEPPPENLVYTTYWSNDSTSYAGSEPSAAVSVTVSGGLFAVRLGDASLANMRPFRSGTFSEPDLHLRIWFSDGVNGFSELHPTQPLTAAPYAWSAAEFTGYLPVTQLAGRIGPDQLGFGAVTTDALDYRVGVWTRNSDNVFRESGLVGIGNNAPQDLLHLTASVGYGIGLRVDSDIEGHAPAVSLKHTGFRGRTFRLASFGDNFHPGSFIIRDDTAGADRVLVTAEGNVGIGTVPQQQLSVAAGMNIDQGESNAGTVFDTLSFGSVSGEAIGSKRTAGGNQWGLDFYTRNTAKMSITKDGLVGIGTTSPGAQLDVRSAGQAYMRVYSQSALNGSVLELRNDASDPNYIGAVNFGTPFGTPGQIGYVNRTGDPFFTGLAFRAGGSEVMKIAEIGCVGIGTTYPVFTLEVNGTAGKPGGGPWSLASDERLKNNIRQLTGTLDKLLELRGVTFEYKDPAKIHELSGERIGMVAQEVEKVFPDWVDSGPDGFKRLTFRGFEALTVEALRDLRAEKDARIAQLEARLKEAQTAIRLQEERLTALERAMAGVSAFRDEVSSRFARDPEE
jgi:hypothetical protein